MQSHPPSTSRVDHLVWQIEGGYAHESFESLLDAVPHDRRGDVPAGLAHSAWQILDHVRRCQRDLIDYVVDESYQLPQFPDDLWPHEPQPPSENAWDTAIAHYLQDRETLIEQVRSFPHGGLDAVLPHVEPTTWHRQVLIVCDHVAYHAGQLSLYVSLLRNEEDRS